MQQTNEFDQILGVPVENWRGCEKPVQSILAGNYCELKPIDINHHSSSLYKILGVDNPPSSWTYLPYGPFNSLNEFQTWLRCTTTTDDTMLYAIHDVNSKQPIGISGYLRINPQHGSIEIGHLHFSELLKRTRLATEAIYLMMRHVFDELGYRRCEWKCNSLNKASCRAAERFGFQFEGIFRQYGVFKGRNRDTAWYSVIDSEWQTLNAKFLKWLDADNFDRSGQQILKLTEC